MMKVIRAGRLTPEHDGSIEPVKSSALYMLFAVEGLLITEALPRIWDAETQALFAPVMSPWFGNRMLSKLREGR